MDSRMRMLRDQLEEARRESVNAWTSNQLQQELDDIGKDTPESAEEVLNMGTQWANILILGARVAPAGYQCSEDRNQKFPNSPDSSELEWIGFSGGIVQLWMGIRHKPW